MLNHTEVAAKHVENAYSIRNQDSYTGDRAADAAYHVALAQVHVALAWEAQLIRIADALEELAGHGEADRSREIWKLPCATGGA